MKKLRWIRLLMGISYLLLVGFVFHWLERRFFDEKKALGVELQRAFVDSDQVMLDSLIIQRMINPVLQSGSANTFSGAEDSSLQFFGQVRRIVRNGSLGFDTSAVVAQILDTAKLNMFLHDKNGKSDREVSSDSEYPSTRIHMFSENASLPVDSLLLQSVRLLIHRVKGAVEEDSNMSHLDFSSGLDTGLLQDAFLNRVANKRLRLVWIGEIDSSMALPPGWIYRSAALNNAYGVKVERTYAYLLQQLWPNILFALILMFLTAIAFVFSYRGYKKQLMINTLRNDIMGNISHELRTPVASVKLALEAIRTYHLEDDPDRLHEYLLLASKEIDRLESLIKVVLLSSLRNEEKPVVRMEMLDVDGVINDVVSMMEVRAKQNSAEILCHEVSDKQPIMVFADLLHFKGVLMNLIDNSLKYAGNASIIIERYQTDEKVFILVRDNGPGIPEEFIPGVFDKFFRVPTGNLHNVKGYGLGLSYVALVMKWHNGRVHVDNNAGGGCTFTLEFPVCAS